MARNLGTIIGRNKKGSILDLIFLGAGLLVFAVAVLITFKLTSSFTTEITGMAGMPTEAIDSSNQLLGQYTGIIDKTALFLLVGVGIAALILAAMIRVHPIFIPIYIIALTFVIFFCGIFSNIYQSMAENAALADEASQLILITNILTYLPLIVGVFGTLLAIVMYKLYSQGIEG